MVSKGKTTIEVSPGLKEAFKNAKGVERTTEEFLELLVRRYKLDKRVCGGSDYVR